MKHFKKQEGKNEKSRSERPREKRILIIMMAAVIVKIIIK